MKTALVLALAGLGAAGAFWRQEAAGPVPADDRTKFLFHGVFEGLVEDGAQVEAVEKILAHKDEWFVPKCPICYAVHAGFRAYASYGRDNGWRSPRKDGLPPWFGAGWPAETIDALKSEDIKTRHGALERLVNRYVDRRFARTKMTEKEVESMRISLKIGMKEGFVAMERTNSKERFPASCPSCEGAN